MTNWAEPQSAGRIANLSGLYFTSLTAGSANTKGSWSQITASTAFDAQGVIVMWAVAWWSSVDEVLLDFGIGGSGSEQVISANLYNTGLGGNSRRMRSAVLPICIPSGSRVAARCQSSLASNANVKATVFLLRATENGAMRHTDYGANTADSAGVTVTASGSANTKGNWTEIISSTSRDIRSLMIAGGCGGVGHATAGYLFDIAVGGSGSEQVILSNLSFHTRSNHDLPRPNKIGPFDISIPSGTRLSTRCQSSTASETLDLVFYGFS